MSTAVFGVAGVAQAAGPPIFISTDPDSGADDVVDGTYTVPAGYCEIAWTLYGGSGGTDSNGAPGDNGGELRVTTEVAAGEEYTVSPGARGGDGDFTAGGTGGEGGSGLDGLAGGVALDPDDGVTVLGSSGGGGGATSVSGEGNSLVAHGGAGAGNDGGAGGGGPTNTVTWPGAVTDTDQTAEINAAGLVEGLLSPCPPEPTPPYQPSWVGAFAGDGTIDVRFTPTAPADEYGTEADTWEYSLDGGSWTEVATTADDWGDRGFTLTGLTNGTGYSIRVRGVSEAGNGTPSEAATAWPAAPIGAPQDVNAVVGPSSITVTWEPPTADGTFPLAGYGVSWGSENRGGKGCDRAVDEARVCVIAAEPGEAYYVQVWAVDSKDNNGEFSDIIDTDEVPGPVTPPTVPSSDGALKAPAGSGDGVEPGQKITLRGSGYLPNSTVTVLIYSEPQVLTTVVTDNDGRFEVTVTVPDGLPAGQHTLVASGVDPDGNVRYLTLPVTVAGGTTGAGGLAYTGVDVQVPLTGGLMALGIGTALILVSRRRRVSA